MKISSKTFTPGTSDLYNYLFRAENYILSSKIFKRPVHAAPLSLRLRGLIGSNVSLEKYKKLIYYETSMLTSAILYRPFNDPDKITWFYEHLWRIVQLRSREICPHGGSCDSCPLATSCRSNFNLKFKTRYPQAVLPDPYKKAV